MEKQHLYKKRVKNLSSEFCIFITIRYVNSKTMGIAHDHMAKTLPEDNFKGRIYSYSYHIAPDKGLGIQCFDTKENMNEVLPVIREYMKDFSAKFDFKYTLETGIVSPELTEDFRHLK